MGFGQYLKDTRGELRHVAWPTRLQTVVYTALVVILSVVVALYLGFFDFLFTSGLGTIVEMLADTPAIQMEQPEIDFTSLATTTAQ